MEIVGLDLYFPVMSEESQDTVSIVSSLYQFFKQHAAEVLPDPLPSSHAVLVNFTEILRLSPPIRSLHRILHEKPLHTIGCISLAIYNVYHSILHRRGDWWPNFPRINARIYNVEGIEVPVKSLKAGCVGRFVCVRGTVVRASTVKPAVVRMAFTCGKCGMTIHKHIIDGKFTVPTKCTTLHCRSKAFLPDISTAVTEDWQKIRERSIQEIIGDDEGEAGRIPKTVDCELKGDLVDSCIPGDDVCIWGIAKVVNVDAEGRGRARNKTMYLVYVDANCIENTKYSNGETMERQEVTHFSNSDLMAVREIATEKDVFRLLVNSLCPGIFGHEVVKAGLLLTLFGSPPRFLGQANRVPVRGDPHILIVGDPGLGKSQLLRAVSSMAPRGVYVCGNTTSASGLTVTVVKDPSTGDFALEAGALVLSDQGVCCIDEFDKMGSEHQALLEAMEQQSISIAKAGIVCSLPARTSVIAAANPVGGHYNQAKTVSENIKLSPALLSRFDLIFLVLDNPNEERDRLLSEHVMSLHTRRRRGVDYPSGMKKHDSRSSLEYASRDENMTISSYLKLDTNMQFDPVPSVLIRKYISYARRYVHPSLSEEAAEVIQEFYLALRKKQNPDCAPITTRQLESLMRLSIARARIELREIVTQDDALDVVDIVKEAFFDTLVDEYGNIDFHRATVGSSGKAKEVVRFVKELKRESERKNDVLFNTQEMRIVAERIRIQTRAGGIEEFISCLNDQGYILKSGPRLYRLQV